MANWNKQIYILVHKNYSILELVLAHNSKFALHLAFKCVACFILKTKCNRPKVYHHLCYKAMINNTITACHVRTRKSITFRYCCSDLLYYCTINSVHILTRTTSIRVFFNGSNSCSSWVRKYNKPWWFSSKIKPDLSIYLTSISTSPADTIIKVIENNKWVSAISNQ